LQNLIFNEFFKSEGGLFETGNLTPGNKLIYDHYKSRASTYIDTFCKHESLIRPRPTIYFDYINNSSLNAIAAKTQSGIYLIGINAGTIFIIHDLFFRMLSNTSILPHIGNASLETKSLPSIRNYYSDANMLMLFGDVNYENYQASIPNDNVRKAYATNLVEIAIDFIVAHELTHIADGHLDFINEKFGTLSYEETTALIENEDQFLTMQTLEMDADCLAVSKGLGNMIRRHLGEQSVSSDRAVFYSEFDNVIFNWTVAVLTLIRIMVECTRYKKLDSKSSHPHPRVRSSMILATIHEYLKNYYSNEYAKFSMKTYSDVFTTVELAYKCVTGNAIDLETIRNGVEHGKLYTAQVLNHWQIIRTKLSGHAYVELV
jgi:hypothetical protein